MRTTPATTSPAPTPCQTVTGWPSPDNPYVSPGPNEVVALRLTPVK